MKEFQNLTITISKAEVDNLADYLSGLSNHWLRDGEKEESVTKFTAEKMFCFNYMVEDDAYASLWLAEKDNDALYVSNIVPLQSSSLSISEYNDIQRKFCSELLSIASRKFTFNLDLSKEHIEIEDLLSNEAAQAFKSFSRLANKSTGRSHPLDQTRWFEFIRLAFESENKISPEQLEKFLVEDGWDQSSSLDLACDFEYSLDLLTYLK
ncbi:hypothetical protein M0357_001581 [Vibrio harveyi]|uniref:hypothetical protein n=1 Tax=Vibrio harveyi TaxID=669 RepID=UPI00298492FA|nr:hypothetical protein [Vibrio harveyi]HDM8130246.1 hypothetical protein [Vibrio harveyi]